MNIHDTRPFGQLASAAAAVALGMKLRGRKDDQDWANVLDRLARQARMHLADEGKRTYTLGDDAAAE